jgi:hypothetical protein
MRRMVGLAVVVAALLLAGCSRDSGPTPYLGTCSEGVPPYEHTCPPPNFFTYDCGQGPQYTYLYTCPP